MLAFFSIEKIYIILIINTQRNSKYVRIVAPKICTSHSFNGKLDYHFNKLSVEIIKQYE